MDAPLKERGRHPLEDVRFREALSRMVRRRVPESDAEDIVQAALAEAFASGRPADDPDGLRRWVWGVARHKVVDHFRRRRRESSELPDVADEREGTEYDELDLLRWAKRELPAGENAEETLRWMLREADGETLETIAEESNVPAPRVRKRVSRLREYFRERWTGQAAALLALGVVLVVLALVAYRWRTGDDIAKDLPPPVPSQNAPTPHEIAEEKRRFAFEKCDGALYRECIDLLDEAKGIDPAGDTAPPVVRARQAAEDALKVVPPPPPKDTKEGPRKGDIQKLKADPTSAPTPTPMPEPTDIAPQKPTPQKTEPAPKSKVPSKPTAPFGGKAGGSNSSLGPEAKLDSPKK